MLPTVWKFTTAQHVGIIVADVIFSIVEKILAIVFFRLFLGIVTRTWVFLLNNAVTVALVAVLLGEGGVTLRTPPPWRTITNRPHPAVIHAGIVPLAIGL